MNNFNSVTPPNFPPPPPQNPNQSILEKLRRDYAAWLALQKKQEEDQAQRNPPTMGSYRTPSANSMQSQASPKRKSHLFGKIFGFFVMCFLTFVFGSMAFAFTRKLPVAVAVWIVGVLSAAFISVRISNKD